MAEQSISKTGSPEEVCQVICRWATQQDLWLEWGICCVQDALLPLLQGARLGTSQITKLTAESYCTGLHCPSLLQKWAEVK